MIYGRIMTKDEAKLLKRTHYLQAAEEGQLIPVFDATSALSFLPEKPDAVKKLHKAVGGSGAGTLIATFETDDLPESGPIEAKKLRWFKEYKFKSGTKVKNLKF